MQQALLTGKVVPGMFKNERGFIIDLGDRILALFVDQSDVDVVGEADHGETAGWLRVFVKEAEGSKVFVYLPHDAGTGERTLLVDRRMVRLVNP